MGYWLVRLSPLLTSGFDSGPLILSFNIIALVVFYINYLFVMPRFVGRKQYGKAVLGWLGLFLLFVSCRYLVEEVAFPAWLGFRNYAEGTRPLYYVYDNIWYGFPVIIFSGLLWFLVSFIKSTNENAVLKLEKNKAELNFLKSQVNPHFLFNNLNNIYALVYQKSDNALSAIGKLSDMMRYMVKDAAQEKILLNRELAYLQDLIDLQLLRVSGKTYVQYEVNGQPEGKNIAPLLLIPFVENGFKHGDVTDAGQPFIIRITITAEGLELYTRNKIAKGNKDTTSGVGLDNLKNRLALLYPDGHTLHCAQEQDVYICNLKLKW